MLSSFLEMEPIVVTEVGFHISCLTLDCCKQTRHLMRPFVNETYRKEDTREKFYSSVCKYHPQGLKQDFPSQIPCLLEHPHTTGSLILLLNPCFKWG